MMQVTRDVVRDLLPLYLSGEASADTRTLVDRFLEQDPELAREALEAKEPKLPPTPGPPPSIEKDALDATRRLLKHRTSTMAVAVLFTLLPLAFAFNGSRVTFLMIRDAPTIGYTWWATAGVMWICHLLILRRLRVSGL